MNSPEQQSTNVAEAPDYGNDIREKSITNPLRICGYWCSFCFNLFRPGSLLQPQLDRTGRCTLCGRILPLHYCGSSSASGSHRAPKSMARDHLGFFRWRRNGTWLDRICKGVGEVARIDSGCVLYDLSGVHLSYCLGCIWRCTHATRHVGRWSDCACSCHCWLACVSGCGIPTNAAAIPCRPIWFWLRNLRPGTQVVTDCAVGTYRVSFSGVCTGPRTAYTWC